MPRDAMLPFDPERVRRNVEQAATEDLLDRVTVYREGMEPEALEIIEAELMARGVSREEIAGHVRRLAGHVFRRDDGTVIPCSFCDRPAVDRRWGWYRGTGWKRLLPGIPWFLYYCPEHTPAKKEGGHPEGTDAPDEADKTPLL